MVQAVIKGLIGILLVALCVFLCIWVLGIIGIHLPPMAVNILFAIAALLCILWLVRLLQPHWGSWVP